jgi:hypothetical protein
MKASVMPCTSSFLTLSSCEPFLSLRGYYRKCSAFMKCTGTYIDHCHRELWMWPDIKLHIRNEEASNMIESQSCKNKVGYTRQAMWVSRNDATRSRNHCCRVKAISVTYGFVLVAVFIIQPTKCMRHIILPSVVCSALPHFSTLSHKRHDFLEKLLNITVSFDFFYNFCLKCISF